MRKLCKRESVPELPVACAREGGARHRQDLSYKEGGSDYPLGGDVGTC